MINIPNEIKRIIELFNSFDHEVYLVGGYVRDSLLGKETYDIDMTTSATPGIVKEILKEYELDDKYSNYGCIKFKLNEYNIEITTFRREYDYKKHRRPSKIEFITDLKEDLKRRDFTINALCYDGNSLIDVFNGLEDLNNKVIRTIGNPLIRFEEDALRMLRALRFSSQLGFKLDNSVTEAINKKCHLIKELNKSVIEKELNNIINGEYYYNLLNNYKEILVNIFGERSR